MTDKTIIITLRSNQTTNKLVIGSLTNDLIDEVCIRTGMDQEQVKAGLDRLESLGLLDQEEVVIH